MSFAAPNEYSPTPDATPTVERHTAEGNLAWRDVFTREEIADLLEMRDWRSWVSVGVNWGVILGTLAVVAAWPNPLTLLVGLFVIGARQLGLAVLMHEAAHRSLFRSRAVNDFVGQWLAAYPTWADARSYRDYHLQHHAHTGSERDPDIGLVRPFPITPESLRRKVLRDLTGRTGIKFARASFRRTFLRLDDPQARAAAIGVAVTNAALLGYCFAIGAPAVFLLWVGAWLTTNTLVTRIRSIAEHALTPNPDDPLGNTRTTLTSWWERAFVAPTRVNYHLEHHLLMTVPHYNLPRFHRLLAERGVLEKACIERGGYAAILRGAASASAA